MVLSGQHVWHWQHRQFSIPTPLLLAECAPWLLGKVAGDGGLRALLRAPKPFPTLKQNLGFVASGWDLMQKQR